MGAVHGTARDYAGILARRGRCLTSRTAALLLLAVVSWARVADAQEPRRILVMPFENVARDARIVWLGEAAAVLLADNLNALGASAITRDERRAALRRLQVPATATLTDATVFRIGQLVGAGQVVVGKLELEGDIVVVQARRIALEAARVQATAVERGEIRNLFDVFDRLARGLTSAAGADAAPRAQPPIAAFENYIKGLLAETPSTAAGYLNAALRFDQTFDRARLALWEVYVDSGDHDRALGVVLDVPESSGWSHRARFMAALSQLSLKRYDQSFATFAALLEAGPTAPVLNNLGVVQLRRGGAPQAGAPTYFFAKAVEADAGEADYFFNLGYAHWLQGDLAATAYWLRETLRRNPADGDAHFVLGVALSSSGQASEAAREKELARRLSSTYAEWDRRPPADPVPPGLERIRNDVELPQARRLEEVLAHSGQRDQEDLARFYIERGRSLFQQERDQDALAELRRALFLAPYQAEAHALAGRIHARNGRAQEAIESLKISLWSRETAEAHAALAEVYLDANDPAAARAEAERALILVPATAAAARVLDKLGGR